MAPCEPDGVDRAERTAVGDARVGRTGIVGEAQLEVVHAAAPGGEGDGHDSRVPAGRQRDRAVRHAVDDQGELLRRAVRRLVGPGDDLDDEIRGVVERRRRRTRTASPTGRTCRHPAPPRATPRRRRRRRGRRCRLAGRAAAGQQPVRRKQVVGRRAARRWRRQRRGSPAPTPDAQSSRAGPGPGRADVAERDRIAELGLARPAPAFISVTFQTTSTLGSAPAASTGRRPTSCADSLDQRRRHRRRRRA